MSQKEHTQVSSNIKESHQIKNTRTRRNHARHIAQHLVAGDRDAQLVKRERDRRRKQTLLGEQRAQLNVAS
jgi:hypothetical protein